jgi:hypothetical protein
MHAFRMFHKSNLMTLEVKDTTTGVPADLDPHQNGPPGPNPLANMDRGVHIR